MRAIFCIATGSATYMQFALNLGLSIKANCEIETVLLHTADAEADLGWDERTLDRRFGYAFDKKVCVAVKETDAKSPLQQAHWIKLTAYDIAQTLGYKEVIILDADTLIVPSKNPADWFDEANGANFSAYCNSYYDFTTGKVSKEGYSFWCEPEDARVAFNLTDKMPQINASFLYFKQSEEAKKVFDIAQDIWHTVDTMDFEFEKYNGSKTEEMCLNISCAINHTYPHKTPFQPVYCQYQHEEQSYPYVTHYFVAISMAGNIMHSPDLCAYYNQLGRYYRSIYGINESFVFGNETKKPKDTPISIPFKRRTIWRAGELPNSDAGVLNPSGIVFNGNLLTIFRKEKSMELYSHKYEHSTALPHLCVNGDEGAELEMIGFPENVRVEDFRLFLSNGEVLASHTIVTDMTNDTIFSKMGASVINGNKIALCAEYELPVKKQLTEKNWVFFAEGERVWCIYSISPYKIFYADAYNDWKEFKAKDPKIRWWQHNRYICNSTNPILIGDSYLMFFHSKDAGVYSHGACLIDKETKEITHYLRNGLNLPFNGHGLQKTILYVSGAVYLEKESTIRLYAGECDTNSVYFDFNKDELINEIKKYKA